MNVTPFDPDRYVGTVTLVTPDSVGANLPYASASPEERTAIRGVVGDFVFVECERFALFGRIIEVRLPDRDRLSVEPELGKRERAHPIGTIRLLTTIDLVSGRLLRGLATHPRIGDRVFVAHPALVSGMIQNEKMGGRNFCLGRLPVAGTDTDVAIPPEKLFGRHCGVLGTTGGGKSWTLARLIEEISTFGGKAILFDATGEFSGLAAIDVNTALGEAGRPGETAASFSYRQMTEADLFTLFNPSGGVQGPKLREAIKSLKLAEAIGAATVQGIRIDGGKIVKENMGKVAFYKAMNDNKDFVYSPYCAFDITKLAAQIENECVWAPSQNNQSAWGGANVQERGYCTTLIGRIETLVHSHELACIFSSKDKALDQCIREFLGDNSKRIMRVSMEHLSFQHNARELIANAIGRYLLNLARQGTFTACPLVVILDEAHQFLDKSIGDEFTQLKLDAFGLIAKEGRKYGLTSVLATQRPRDIPEDVLSQLGTLIVHRLINDRDRLVVERACGELDKSATAFLPTLDQGEALLVGADFPMPIPIRVHQPSTPPNSSGPNYQGGWLPASLPR